MDRVSSYWNDLVVSRILTERTEPGEKKAEGEREGDVLE